MNKNTSIKVCGQLFDTGTRVVLWDEPEGFSFYPYKKFHAHDWTLEEARKHINAIFIHHSVTYRSSHMFGGLKARGLSVNFMIDDDVNENGCSTIFQCLDARDLGFSQGGIYNHNGVGVELSYFPDAWTQPLRYSEANKKKYNVPDHPILSDTIHGHTFKKVYGPTEAQVKACIKLIHAYSQAFPDLKLEFPRDKDGKFISTVVPEEQAVGLLHHFNVKRGKVDAMGFPTDRVEKELNDLKKKVTPKLKLPKNIFKWLKELL